MYRCNWRVFYYFLLFFCLLFGLYACNTVLSSASIEKAISHSVAVYDNLFEDRDRKDIYVVRKVEMNDDSTSVVFSVDFLSNGNILEDLEPFLYGYIEEDIVILKDFSMDKDFIGMDLKNDTILAEEITFQDYGVIFDFRKYHIVSSPIIGVFKYSSRNKRKGSLSYFITHPLNSVPIAYRPIKNYHQDKDFMIDSIGEMSFPFSKDYFSKFDDINEMFEMKETIRFK